MLSLYFDRTFSPSLLVEISFFIIKLDKKYVFRLILQDARKLLIRLKQPDSRVFQ